MSMHSLGNAVLDGYGSMAIGSGGWTFEWSNGGMIWGVIQQGLKERAARYIMTSSHVQKEQSVGKLAAEL